MTKAEMIQRVMQAAKSAAIAQGKHFDSTDVFFSLAFMPDANLKKLCKKLGVA
jgi:hypothetical protein